MLCQLTGIQIMAQSNPPESGADSIPVKKTKMVFAFDARFSSAHDQNVRINGIKLGWERFEKNRYGIGIYALRDPIPIDNEQSEIYNLEGIDTDTLKLFSNLSYAVIFWDHILTNKKKYEVALNLEFGTGSAKLGYQNSEELDEDGNPSITNLDEVSFGVLEFSFAGHYKILPWIGPGAGLGYRTVFAGDENVGKAFSGPIAILKVKVFLGALYKGIFRRKKKDKTE